jgi:hypothetical protein
MPENEVFKVFVKMYFDDFLVDCSMNGESVQKDKFSGENPASVEIMGKYLNEKIVLKVNDKKLVATWQDLHVVDNEMSINVVYKNVKKPRTLTLKNLIMTSLYSDQANMVIIRINDFEEGVKLTTDLTEMTFKIK